jgi:hypothetical protein
MLSQPVITTETGSIKLKPILCCHYAISPNDLLQVRKRPARFLKDFTTTEETVGHEIAFTALCHQLV